MTERDITRGGGWIPADQAEVWAEYVITDGENIAIAQLAEADYGGTYWATEFGVTWEPTLCTSWPPTTAPKGPSVGIAAGDEPKPYEGNRATVVVPDREAIARIILEHVSDADPDELIHQPWQKSWEAPTRPRWDQFTEVAAQIIALSAPPSVVGASEPVAWQWRLTNLDGSLSDNWDMTRDPKYAARIAETHPRVEPLYTTPPLPKAGEGEREEIDLTGYVLAYAGCPDAWRVKSEDEPRCPAPNETMIRALFEAGRSDK